MEKWGTVIVIELAVLFIGSILISWICFFVFEAAWIYLKKKFLELK